MLDVAFVVAMHEPNWEVTERIVDAHGEALDHAGLHGLTFLVDNSPHQTGEARAWAQDRGRGIYLWQGGKNIFIAGAVNLVADISGSRFMVYTCANHGRAIHPRWLLDLISPLNERGVGVTGCIKPCRFSCVPSRRARGRNENVHIQGGIWASRTETVRDIQSSDLFPQCYNDVEWSMAILDRGLRLVDVPSVCSVASGLVEQLPHHTYIHDYR